MAPQLSVLIAAYQNGDLLDLTLGALARQTLPTAEFEVIVCDDASQPSLKPVADKHAGQVDLTYVGTEQNRGRSANRNAGVARARGEVLVFLDADTVPHPDLLRRHAEFHAARRPGVLLGRRYEIDWIGADTLRRGELPTAQMLDGHRADLRDPHLTLPEHRADFSCAPWVFGFSHNLSMDRGSFDAVGGFDENILKWGMEDNDICYRIFHHYDCRPDVFVLSDDATSYHLPHYRAGVLLMDMVGSTKYLARKHRRCDFEAMYSPITLGVVMSRARRFADAVAVCHRTGLGRPVGLPAGLRGSLAAKRVLAIGFGVADLALGPGSRTFDHDAPLTDDNWHLLGLMMQQFKTGEFDLIVHIDLWRFLTVDELNALVRLALMKSAELHLVASHDAPDQASLLPLPFVADPEPVAQLLQPYFSVETRRADQATILTIR